MFLVQCMFIGRRTLLFASFVDQAVLMIHCFRWRAGRGEKVRKVTKERVGSDSLYNERYFDTTTSLVNLFTQVFSDGSFADITCAHQQFILVSDYLHKAENVRKYLMMVNEFLELS